MLLCLKAQFLFEKLALLMARHSTVKLLHQSPLAFPRRQSQNIQQFICVAHSAKNSVFYTGGTVPTGPAVVPRSNESIHTSGSLFSQASSASDGERARTHSKRNRREDKQTQACARAHKTFFQHRIKVTCLALCRGLLTFNRFQDPSIV